MLEGKPSVRPAHLRRGRSLARVSHCKPEAPLTSLGILNRRAPSSGSTQNMAATSTAAAASRLNGKWKPNPAKSDSMEPFLTEMGVSWLLRQAAKRKAPVMEMHVTGTTFRQVMAGPMGMKTDNGGDFGTVRSSDFRSPAPVCGCVPLAAQASCSKLSGKTRRSSLAATFFSAPRRRRSSGKRR